MKRLLTLTLVAIIPLIMIGQEKSHSLKDVLVVVENNKVLLSNWEVDETKDHDGIKILRLQGENDPYTRTNLSYYPSADQINPAAIALFFDRRQPHQANGDVMTLKIIDAETNEVYATKTFEDKKPYLYAGDIWYNYLKVNIPQNFANRLVVQINDAGSDKEYKFLIYNIPVDNIEPSDKNVTQTRR